jgi:hypothetical protein
MPWLQKPLTPILIDANDPAHSTVVDLKEAIKDEDILNIAVTGPYGSGKSSALRTFQKEIDGSAKVLDISLATLEADESLGDDAQETHENGHKEIINRKIEYSILQQLVYRKKLEDLPYSRLRKIRHFSSEKITMISIFIICYLACIGFAFNISWLQISDFYSIFNIPVAIQNSIKIISGIFLLLMTYDVLKYLIRNFAGLQPQKISVAGNEIDVQGESSIFNRYLDEILYFFQCTDYDVVLIEDLDRFNNTDIFLKLRELNHLINKSEAVGRKIRFIYAVKDDMFKDSSRSKFFDYITTVIPVITTNNSKDKLKRALSEQGHGDEINDDDIREIAFHINDMRLLYNIVNEYHQYSIRLNNNQEHQLEAKKMLAMMTVKNYFPHDFSELNKRSGRLYNAISPKAKREYIEFAIKNNITEREKIVKDKQDAFVKSEYLSEKEIRTVYLYAIIEQIRQEITSITINGNDYTISNIINSNDLFEKLISNSTLTYKYREYGIYTDHLKFNFSEIEESINPDFTYKERIDSLRYGKNKIEAEIKNLETEKQKISTYSIQDLIERYGIYKEDFFKKKGLPPMEEDFIRSGLIAEDYDDYISYFYPDIMPLADHQLCLDMKLDRDTEFDTPISNVKLFIEELPKYAFNYDSIWNYTLLKYLTEHKKAYSDYYDLYINNLLEKESAHFIASCTQNGDYIEYVYQDCMKIDAEKMWQKIQPTLPDEQNILYRLWLLTCKVENISDQQISWINSHYGFTASVYDRLSQEMKDYLTSSDFHYDSLTKDSDKMLNEVIENDAYILNENNITLVVEQKGAKSDISKLIDKQKMSLAIELNLIAATWNNIKTYYETCGEQLDDTIINFIERNIDDLISKPIGDKSFSNLSQHLFEAGSLSNDSYEKLCEAMNFVASMTESILSLPEDKLIILIHSGSLPRSDESIEALANVSVRATCEYILYDKANLTHYLQTVPITTELAEALLSNSGFNQEEFYKIIAVLDPISVTVSQKLADRLCSLLSIKYSVCDVNIFIKAINLCSNEDTAIMAAANKIRQIKDDESTITNILAALPTDYHYLVEGGKHPKLRNTKYNLYLVEQLSNADYISSFSTDDKYIKVNTKRKVSVQK